VKKSVFEVAVVFVLLVIGGCVSSVENVQVAPVVAVWNLENSSLGENGLGDLGELLSLRVVETFQSKGYKVVEREQLVLALEELNIGSSALASESTQLKLGHLLGARWMVFGGYQVIAGQMRMDLRLVDVETGRILNAAEKTASTSRGIMAVLAVAEDVTNDLLN